MIETRKRQILSCASLSCHLANPLTRQWPLLGFISAHLPKAPRSGTESETRWLRDKLTLRMHSHPPEKLQQLTQLINRLYSLPYGYYR